MTGKWRERLSREQRQGLEGALRASESPLSSASLREELVLHTGRAIPADGAILSTHDPELGLISHSVVSGVSCPTVLRWLSAFYPQEGALELLEMARHGEWSTTRRTPLYDELFGTQGIGHRLQVVLQERGVLWGSWWLMRDTKAPAFSMAEIAAARSLAPRMVLGLRRAAARELAVEKGASLSPGVPGVVAFDRHGRATMRDEAAATYLRDLMDLDRRPLERDGQLPSAVSGALAKLYLRQAGKAPNDLPVRVRGESGRWYAVHAAFLAPEGDEPRGLTGAVITPASQGDRASLFARLYGLTPREREVVARLARGESTKQIAAALAVSAYTVQEHVSTACRKVGVSRRRELLARLYLDSRA